MKKEDAMKHSTCADCKRILEVFKNPETDFGLYEGHIFHTKLSAECDMLCLCRTLGISRGAWLKKHKRMRMEMHRQERNNDQAE